VKRKNVSFGLSTIITSAHRERFKAEHDLLGFSEMIDFSM
jgi:hypothetical protein